MASPAWNGPGLRVPWVVRRAAWATLDVILPPRCAGCQRWGDRFCVTCRSGLAALPTPVCPHCGYPQAAPQLCRSCRALSRPALTAIRSAAFFEGTLQKAIHRLKYRHDAALAEALGPLLQRCWRKHRLKADIIVPVPLSRERLWQRGYNQAELLAEALAERVGVPCVPSALRRVRDTASQVNLGWAERQTNVAGAFEASADPVRGKVVVLADDVCTTGATLNSSAEALISAGALEVWAITLARARRDPIL